MTAQTITVQTIVHAPLEKVWAYWNQPEHISGWAFASDDWEATSQGNDLQVGGRFTTRMQAKDQSMGFDFAGVYTAVTENEYLAYTLDDGRTVQLQLTDTGDGVQVVQTFEQEMENSREEQRQGWQAFLDNFKKYAESR